MGSDVLEKGRAGVQIALNSWSVHEPGIPSKSVSYRLSLLRPKRLNNCIEVLVVVIVLQKLTELSYLEENGNSSTDQLSSVLIAGL